MSDFFQQRFGSVADMLERERQQSNARATKPWRLMSLSLGKPDVVSDHDTEQQARDALAQVLSTCAPFIRDTFWIEGD